MTKQSIPDDWNDEECVNILKKCKEAITGEGKKGRVIMIDLVVDDENKDDESIMKTRLLYDIY